MSAPRLFDPPTTKPCAAHGTLAVWLHRDRCTWACLICEPPKAERDVLTIWRADEKRGPDADVPGPRKRNAAGRDPAAR